MPERRRGGTLPKTPVLIGCGLGRRTVMSPWTIPILGVVALSLAVPSAAEARLRFGPGVVLGVVAGAMFGGFRHSFRHHHRRHAVHAPSRPRRVARLDRRSPAPPPRPPAPAPRPPPPPPT